LYEAEIRRVREEGFEKLKKALHYTEQEQLDTVSSSSISSTYSSTDSRNFNKIIAANEQSPGRK